MKGARAAAALSAALRHWSAAVGPAVLELHLVSLRLLQQASAHWQERSRALTRRHRAHPALVDELLQHERFVVPAAAHFHALHARCHSPGNAQRLDQALHALASANPSKLRGCFDGLSFTALALLPAAGGDAAMGCLLEALVGPAPTPAPGAAGPGASTDTPAELATLLARLTAPRSGEAIGDPACGRGTLLVACAQEVARAHAAARSSGMAHCELWGQDADRSSAALTRLNLLLQGHDNHRIECGDTLRDPRLLTTAVDATPCLRRFDVLVSDLPCGISGWGSAAALHDRFGRFHRGVPSAACADYAFISHMVQTLRPGTGRMAAVVPHGVLFRGGVEGRIRTRLLQEHRVDAVIGLPPKLGPRSAAAMAVLMLREPRPDRGVLVIDASAGFEPGRYRNRLREADIERIVTAYRRRRSEAGYAACVNATALIEGGGDLGVARHVSTAQPLGMGGATELARERRRLMREWERLRADIDAAWQAVRHA